MLRRLAVANLIGFVLAGTTILAAERVGRRAYSLELEPKYVDVAIRRWQAFTRRDAVHAETGQTFEEVAGGRKDARPARAEWFATFAGRKQR